MNIVAGATRTAYITTLQNAPSGGVGLSAGLTWSTSNAAVATVAGAGSWNLTPTITGVAAGTCTISATCTSTSGATLTISFTVVVTAAETAGAAIGLALQL